MAERSAISQVVQIGVESTSGTPVAATRRLQATDIRLAPEVDGRRFRPSGQKFPTLAYLTKESAVGDITGDAAYNELPYLLSSLMGASSPAVAQVMDSATPTGGYTWTFTPSPFTEDTIKTFTVERGSAVRAHRAAYVMVRELGLSITREAAELTGSVMGQRIGDGITLTPSGVLSQAAVPIRPTEVDIYLDPTSGALGTTKLTRALGFDFTLGDRFGGVWPLDSSQPSFAAHVETEPTLEATLRLEADTQGMGLLTALRANTTQYLRLKCTGPTIYTGGVTVTHKLQLDMCVNVEDTGGFDESDGLETVEWNLTGVTDPAWGTGKAVTAQVVTNLAAL